MKHPKRGVIYTLETICNVLDLRDSPSLGFTHAGRDGVIQDAHLTVAELLSVPELAETQWRYRYETSEWIPVFDYVDARPITDFVDVAPYLDCCDGTDTGSWWATPKGFPREQRVFMI